MSNNYEAVFAFQSKEIKSLPKRTKLINAYCKIEAGEIVAVELEELARKLNKRKKGFASVSNYLNDPRKPALFYGSKLGNSFKIFGEIL
jgi:hypothetical protein